MVVSGRGGDQRPDRRDSPTSCLLAGASAKKTTLFWVVWAAGPVSLFFFFFISLGPNLFGLDLIVLAQLNFIQLGCRAGLAPFVIKLFSWAAVAAQLLLYYFFFLFFFDCFN